MERIAVYPGSFDPVTNGHLDILERGLTLFDKIIMVILYNPTKKSCFSLDERIDLLKITTQSYAGVEIDYHNGLTVEYAKKRGACAILRGMRAVSDFEYEFQMALMNRKLQRDVQTVFLMTGLRWIFTSSSIIKEAGMFGGDIDDMVPPEVSRRLKEKFTSGRTSD
jgi:pantetheine-phosphate adenylyltransferase